LTDPGVPDSIESNNDSGAILACDEAPVIYGYECTT